MIARDIFIIILILCVVVFHFFLCRNLLNEDIFVWLHIFILCQYLKDISLWGNNKIISIKNYENS